MLVAIHAHASSRLMWRGGRFLLASAGDDWGMKRLLRRKIPRHGWGARKSIA